MGKYAVATAESLNVKSESQDFQCRISIISTIDHYRNPSTDWAIALNFFTPGVEEQWNSSGVSYKSCGILLGFSQKSWNSLGVKH